MKKLPLLPLVLVLIIFNSCNTKQTDNAVAYNDKLIKSFDPVIDRMIEFEMAIYDDETPLEEIYNEMKTYSDSSLSAIQQMPVFQDGDSLKQKAIAVLQFYNRIISDDYQKILTLISASDTLSTEAEAFIDFLLRESYKEEGTVMDAFEKEQQNFAKRHNFKIDNSVPTKQHLLLK